MKSIYLSSLFTLFWFFCFFKSLCATFQSFVLLSNFTTKDAIQLYSISIIVHLWWLMWPFFCYLYNRWESNQIFLEKLYFWKRINLVFWLRLYPCTYTIVARRKEFPNVRMYANYHLNESYRKHIVDYNTFHHFHNFHQNMGCMHLIILG